MENSIFLPHGTVKITIYDALKAVLEKAKFPGLVDIYMEVSKDADGIETILENGRIEIDKNDGKELAACHIKQSFQAFCTKNGIQPRNPYSPFVSDYDGSTESLDCTYTISIEELQLFAKGYEVQVSVLDYDQTNPNHHIQEDRGREQYETMRCFGRYTIEGAAWWITQSTAGNMDSMIGKLSAAALDGTLNTYNPTTLEKVIYDKNLPHSSPLRIFFEVFYWDNLNTWLTDNERGIVFRFQNPEENDLIPFKSLSEEIQTHIDKPLKKLPSAISNRIRNNPFFQMHDWDALSPAQRDSLAQQYDMQHDPALEGERTYEWFETTLGASCWWRLPSVEPLQAAILLVGLNPLATNEEEARQITTEETTPEDFKRIMVAFNAFQRVDSKPKKLSEWLQYAKDSKLKIHTWIEEWKSFHETTTDSKDVLSTSEGQAKEVQPFPWISKARELATNYINAWRDAGFEPSVDNAALYVEGEFSNLNITGARGNYLDQATIKREALTGITGRKPGEKTKLKRIPDGKRGKLP